MPQPHLLGVSTAPPGFRAGPPASWSPDVPVYLAHPDTEAGDREARAAESKLPPWVDRYRVRTGRSVDGLELEAWDELTPASQMDLIQAAEDLSIRPIVAVADRRRAPAQAIQALALRCPDVAQLHGRLVSRLGAVLQTAEIERLLARAADFRNSEGAAVPVPAWLARAVLAPGVDLTAIRPVDVQNRYRL